MLKTIQIFDYAAIKPAMYKRFPELVALELNPTKVFAFLPNGFGLEVELFNATNKVMAKCKKQGFVKDAAWDWVKTFSLVSNFEDILDTLSSAAHELKGDSNESK